MPPVDVAVVYHSAAGGTRVVAELISELLTPHFAVTVASIDRAGTAEIADAAPFLVLCFPTYFLRPSQSMQTFVGGLRTVTPRRPVYLVTTYELYTENSLRTLADRLRAAGRITVGASAVRAPGTDLACVFPDWLTPGLYRFGARFPLKLREISNRIARSIPFAAGARVKARVPAWKWYTPIAWSLQRAFFDGFIDMRKRIHILSGRCTDCGACVGLCTRGAWSRSGGILKHEPDRCELCTRCIHHCPVRAIVLLDARQDNRRLTRGHYARLKARASSVLMGRPMRGERRKHVHMR